MSCKFMSCIFMPCYLVRQFHVLQFHIWHFSQPKTPYKATTLVGWNGEQSKRNLQNRTTFFRSLSAELLALHLEPKITKSTF